MYYPGQPVKLLRDEKKVGIFMGEADGRKHGKYNAEQYYYVAVLTDDESDVEHELFDNRDMHPIMEESADTITKQRIYYGPKKDKNTYTIRRRAWNSIITDAEFNQERQEWAALLKEIKEKELV